MDGLLFLYNLKLEHLLDIVKIVSGSYIDAGITCPKVSETRYVLNHMVIIWDTSFTYHSVYAQSTSVYCYCTSLLNNAGAFVCHWP